MGYNWSMEWLVKNKWFVFAVVVLGFGIWWFQLRPAQIRSECAGVASTDQALGSWTPAEGQASYEMCLHQQGL